MACENLANSMVSLQCNVCMEKFQASGQMRPKILPCQHSFCFRCLSKISTKMRVECPLCKSVFQKNIEDLPNNHRLLQLIDSVVISPREATSPTLSALSSSETIPVVDCVAMIDKYCREPTKLIPQLKLYLQAPKPAEFNAEHLSTILQCLERYLLNPLQVSDILILSTQILADFMVKFAKCMSDKIKEQLFKNTMQVVTTGSISGRVQSSSITIFYHLITSGFKGKYTCGCTKSLFGFLHKPLQMIEEINLLVVLASSTSNLQETEKDKIGSRHNVKKLLEVIESNWPVDAYVYIVLETLVNLTNLTTTPCCNVVQEGGLNPLERILKDPTRIEEVLENAMILLNNISEFDDLKRYVIKERGLMETIVTHLQSKNVTVSVMSANTITHLTVVDVTEWMQLCGAVDIRETALKNMNKQVRSWIKTDPGILKFQHNSFVPLFSILQTYNSPPCQLFVAWLLRKSCYDNKERFQTLLIKDDGLSVLRSVKKNKSSTAELKKVIKDILRSISSK